MKNITLAVEEDILAKVRKYAAANNTTVNSLVRDYLARLVAQEDRVARAREELIALANSSTFDPGPDWKWNREALYDRGVFSRHQHSAVRGFEEPGASDKKDDRD